MQFLRVISANIMLIYIEKPNTAIALSPRNYLEQIYKTIDDAQTEVGIAMMGLNSRKPTYFIGSGLF